jgi:hypothetical protein
MSFQCFDQRREKRDQPLGADAIGGRPRQMQRLLHFVSIVARTRAGNLQMQRSGVIEQPNGVLARITCGCHKFVQDRTFLALWCLLIAGSDLHEQFPLGSKTHR